MRLCRKKCLTNTKKGSLNYSQIFQTEKMSVTFEMCKMRCMQPKLNVYTIYEPSAISHFSSRTQKSSFTSLVRRWRSKSCDQICWLTQRRWRTKPRKKYFICINDGRKKCRTVSVTEFIIFVESVGIWLTINLQLILSHWLVSFLTEWMEKFFVFSVNSTFFPNESYYFQNWRKKPCYRRKQEAMEKHDCCISWLPFMVHSVQNTV